MVNEAKAQLAKQFPGTHLEIAYFFLRIEIKWKGDINLIRLCQSAYIQKVLERFNLVEAHTASTPLNPVTKLEGNPGTVDDEEVDEPVYRSMIRNLMHLMLCTQRDIAFAVEALSQYCSLPRTSHLNAAKHLFR